MAKRLRRCQECGSSADQDAAACPKCGNKFGADSSKSSAGQYENSLEIGGPTYLRGQPSVGGIDRDLPPPTASLVIKCKRLPIPILWPMNQPYCIVDGKKVNLKWGADTRIALSPYVKHFLRVEYLHLDLPANTAILEVTLKEGEAQEYLYSIAKNLTVFSAGEISRTR